MLAALLALAVTLAGCDDERTGAQRHRDNVTCLEFSARAPAESADAAYKRCMEGGPARYDWKDSEDTAPRN